MVAPFKVKLDREQQQRQGIYVYIYICIELVGKVQLVRQIPLIASQIYAQQQQQPALRVRNVPISWTTKEIKKRRKEKKCGPNA